MAGEKNRIYLEERQRLRAIGKALSSEVRIQMLELLESDARNVNEIAEELDIPASSAAVNVRVLEEAGLIRTSLKPGVRGSMKICEKAAEELHIVLASGQQEELMSELITMPIGNFVDYKAEPTCGIVNEEGHIDLEDEPRVFYNPRRTEATLLWLGHGYLEYRFPNNERAGRTLAALSLSAELCSEAHDYDLDYPSDITLWINGEAAGTWHCPSDYGGRRGRLNPLWWPDKNTQYGEWKTWTINEKGTFLDGEQISPKTMQAYRFEEYPYIAVRIGISDDAVYKGGMNLFGSGFGDYAQDIEMKLIYK